MAFPHEKDRRFIRTLLPDIQTKRTSAWKVGWWDLGEMRGSGGCCASDTAKESVNISTGCEAGKRQELLIYSGQKTCLEKTPVICNVDSFVL